ncbi:MAG: PfkB family carbohydrate kinase [Nitrospirales bacterium]|nr:adenylyltransferase/cytidyltransferase family protein [Nitrospira sp.]MDR4502350.1 PfkB family carbohydrate kinase [Nitrospirales bacterium]
MGRIAILSKTRSLEDLSALLDEARLQGKTIVHCHGVFDLLHVGHIRHLEEAKALGDVLIVTVTPDCYVNKGPHRPAFQQDLRIESIAALDAVDYVAVNRWETAENAIKILKPDIYVKGPDYGQGRPDLTGGLSKEEDAVESVGGRLEITNTVQYSSTSLLNRYVPLFPPDMNGWLGEFRDEYTSGEILDYLERLRELRVVVIGEAIIDEYVYCNALGKSSKEPILAMQFDSKEKHLGGSLAIANHLADFCGEVRLVTYLGTIHPHERFIRENLKPNVQPEFVMKSGSSTIVKRRFIEQYQFSKLFEVYEMNDAFLTPHEHAQLSEILAKELAHGDVAMVADFGHGLLSPEAIRMVESRARFLAVNTQINAANLGYHTISRYRKADYISIQEKEIRVDRRDPRGKLNPLVESLSRELQCPSVMVTQGNKGTLLYQQGQGFFESPSLATKVVDRVGAGDALFALTAPCVAMGVPADVVGFIGNLAGAQAVMTVGNSRALDRVQLLRSVESLLK